VVVVATGHAFNPRTNKVIKDFTVIIKFDKAATASRVGIDSYILCIFLTLSGYIGANLYVEPTMYVYYYYYVLCS